MASPQRENGHLDVANDIVEHLAKIQLSGYESRVLWALWRKTWCWVIKDKNGKMKRDKDGEILKKKKESISSKEWENLTLMSKHHISGTLRKLRLRRIVAEFGNKNEWGFQKDYDKWLPSIKNIVTKNGNTYFVTENGNTFTEIGNEITEIGNEKIPKGLFKKEHRAPKETFKETIKERNIYTIFSFWNSLKIKVHRDIKKFKPSINAILQLYSVEEIKEAISNYSKILESKEYFWTYRWSLGDFLSRKNGIDTFLTVNKPFENFKREDKGKEKVDGKNELKKWLENKKKESKNA